MKRLLFLTLLSFVLFSSCTNFSELDVKEVKLKKFKLVNTSKADVTFEYLVDNPTKTTLIITSAEGFITKKGVNFAQIGLSAPDTISPKAITYSMLTFQVDLLDPISLLSMGLNVSSWRVQDFNLDARITVKTAGGMKKILRFKDVPLERLINKL